MPQRPVIHRLPADVRKQLDHRLIAADFGGLRETSAWLRGLGHRVGKSTVGLYARQLRLSVAEATPGTPGAAAPVAVRLACLAAAAHAKGSPAAVLERATAYVAWATLAPATEG